MMDAAAPNQHFYAPEEVQRYNDARDGASIYGVVPGGPDSQLQDGMHGRIVRGRLDDSKRFAQEDEGSWRIPRHAVRPELAELLTKILWQYQNPGESR